MARKRRDITTAAAIKVGDLIEPNNTGFRARVTWVGTHPHLRKPHVLIAFVHLDDFHGQPLGDPTCPSQQICRRFRPDDRITRWR